MDYFRILSEAFRISWNHKQLWWFGVIVGLPFLSIIPVLILIQYLIHQSMLPGFIANVEAFNLSGTWFILFLVLFSLSLITMVSSIGLSAVGTTGTTLGVLRALARDRGSFRHLLKESLPFFWRALGLRSLYFLAALLVMVLMQWLVMFIYIVTFGLGMVLTAPMMFLISLVLMVGMGYMELCLITILVENTGTIEAIRRTWSSFKQYFWQVAFIGLLVSIIQWLVSMVFTLPLVAGMSFLQLVPLMWFQTDVAAMEEWMSILSTLMIIVLVLLIPFVFLLMGWTLAFYQSCWALVFNRLKKPAAPVTCK